MRAQEFMAEHMDDLHIWVTMAKNAIMDKINSGEIPNNSDSIKNASEQIIADLKDEVIGISPEIISAEVENKVNFDMMISKAHLSGNT